MCGQNHVRRAVDDGAKFAEVAIDPTRGRGPVGWPFGPTYIVPTGSIEHKTRRVGGGDIDELRFGRGDVFDVVVFSELGADGGCGVVEIIKQVDGLRAHFASRLSVSQRGSFF